MKKKPHTHGGETLLVQVSKRDFNRFEKVSKHLNTPIEQLARRILSDVIECEYYDMKATLKN
jgi:hypothetical protein